MNERIGLTMANKPGEANFFPDVPSFPSMGTFQPIYGKFDLTTYIQGASDYEIMAFLVGKYNACLEAYGTVTKLSTDTVTACKQLQDWINSWFDNLDVQEELNNKIDSMLADGSFGQLLSEVVSAPLTAPSKYYVVTIGDSYGEGYTPEGMVTPWCVTMKNYLNIPDSQFETYVRGGTGFTVGPDGKTFLDLLNNASSAHPERVSHVILLGGQNDYLNGVFSSNAENFTNKIVEFVNAAKKKYPNSKIVLGYNAHCDKTQPDAQIKTGEVAFAQGCSYSGYALFDRVTSEMCMYNTRFASDNRHPDGILQSFLGASIGTFLNGGITPIVDYPRYSVEASGACTSCDAKMAVNLLPNTEGRCTFIGTNGLATFNFNKARIGSNTEIGTIYLTGGFPTNSIIALAAIDNTWSYVILTFDSGKLYITPMSDVIENVYTIKLASFFFITPLMEL